MISTLRWVGLIEGISLILLLFFAMPMKYIFEQSIFVKYIGMGHGILFVLYLLVLFVVSHRMKWSMNMFLMGFIGSLLPFGTFLFDLKLKKLVEPERPTND